MNNDFTFLPLIIYFPDTFATPASPPLILSLWLKEMNVLKPGVDDDIVLLGDLCAQSSLGLSSILSFSSRSPMES